MAYSLVGDVRFSIPVGVIDKGVEGLIDPLPEYHSCISSKEYHSCISSTEDRCQQGLPFHSKAAAN